MKKIIYLFTAISLYACSKSHNGETKISGKLSNNQVEKIYLEELSPTKIDIKDSAEINKDGQFTLYSKISDAGFYRLRTATNNAVVLILDSAQNISIEADASDLNGTCKVDGSQDSKAFQEMNVFLKSNAQFRDSLQQVFKQFNYHPDQDSIGKALEIQYNKSLGELTDYVKDFIDKNTESFVCLAAIEQLNPDTDFEYFKKVNDALSKKYPNSEYVKGVSKKISDLSKLSVGSVAPDFMLYTPNGSPLSLSSLKGKSVMIDFWASWCKPCRMENPNVVRLYNIYKNKGFEILGVSLDQDKNAWLQAIQQDGLTWLHISDLAAWKSMVVPLYNITGIPLTVLIDKEGKILAKNLRGVELEKKLAEIFK